MGKKMGYSSKALRYSRQLTSTLRLTRMIAIDIQIVMQVYIKIRKPRFNRHLKFIIQMQTTKQSST